MTNISRTIRKNPAGRKRLRIAISITVDKQFLAEIDAERGDIPRSRYLEKLALDAYTIKRMN